MNWANSEWVWLLLLLPVYLIFVYLVEKRKNKDLKKIAHPEIIHKLTRNLSFKKRKIKKILICCALMFIVFSLMGPQWGRKLVKIERKGIDIVFVIDVSTSMLAEDIKPSRLEKAKIQLSTFIDKLKGDRVGLVVFAGSSFVSCPLTLDYNALKLFIDHLSPEMVIKQGTHIANALKTARSCFNAQERKYKTIVLLTDGENHGAGPIEEAKICRKEGVRIYTIGLGKRKGEPIPLKNNEGVIEGYLKDLNGNIVMSRLDELTLQKIAIETEGKYVYSQFGDLELEKIYAHMQTMEKRQLATQKRTQLEHRFQYFVLLAFILLFAESMLSDRKSRPFIKWLSENKILSGRYE